MPIPIAVREKIIKKYASGHPLVSNAYEFFKDKAKKIEEHRVLEDHSLFIGHRMLSTNDPVLVAAGLLHRFNPDELPAFGGKKHQHELVHVLKTFEKMKAIDCAKEKITPSDLQEIQIQMKKEPRAILLFLHDAYDSLREEIEKPTHEAVPLAKNTLEYWSHIAHSVSWSLAARMEDAAFQILEPEKYEKLKNFVTEGDVDYSNALAVRIRNQLKAKNIDATVSSRVKGLLRAYNSAPYAIIKNAEKINDETNNKKRSFVSKKISDLLLPDKIRKIRERITANLLNRRTNDKYGVRVIIHSLPQNPEERELYPYKVESIVKDLLENSKIGNSKLEEVENQRRDWIRTPKLRVKGTLFKKPLVYQGLHLRFKTKPGKKTVDNVDAELYPKRVEVQIKTEEQHKIAEEALRHVDFKRKTPLIKIISDYATLNHAEIRKRHYLNLISKECSNLYKKFYEKQPKDRSSPEIMH